MFFVSSEQEYHDPSPQDSADGNTGDSAKPGTHDAANEKRRGSGNQGIACRETSGVDSAEDLRERPGTSFGGIGRNFLAPFLRQASSYYGRVGLSEPRAVAAPAQSLGPRRNKPPSKASPTPVSLLPQSFDCARIRSKIRSGGWRPKSIRLNRNRNRWFRGSVKLSRPLSPELKHDAFDGFGRWHVFQ